MSESEPRTILLIAYLNSQLPELLRVARFIQQNQNARPILLFQGEFDIIKSKYIDECVHYSITIINRFGQPITGQSDSPQPQGIGVRLRQQVDRGTAVAWLGRLVNRLYRHWKLLTLLPALKKQLRQAEQLLGDLHINLLVLAEENPLYHTAVYTMPARKLGIQAVVVPYTMANAREAAEHAFHDPARQIRGPLSRIISRRFPHWVYMHKNRRLLLLEPLEIVVQENLKIAPTLPWTLNDGQSTIAVESPMMVKYYALQGIKADRLVLTGAISDDALFRTQQQRHQRRTTLLQKLKLDSHKPIILCAYPPPWFPRPECDFTDYRTMTDFWMTTMASQNDYHVLVNLHPRLQYDQMKYIEKYGVIIVTDDITELIPLADIYIANISATIRWAIACGIPVLNYDVYKYRFHDYDIVGGVVTVEDTGNFIRTFQRLVSDHKYLATMVLRQKSIMHEWGMIDGRSAQRLHQLFDRLQSKPSATLLY